MKTNRIDPLMLLMGKRPALSGKTALNASFEVALLSAQQQKAPSPASAASRLLRSHAQAEEPEAPHEPAVEPETAAPFAVAAHALQSPLERPNASGHQSNLEAVTSLKTESHFTNEAAPRPPGARQSVKKLTQHAAQPLQPATTPQAAEQFAEIPWLATGQPHEALAPAAGGQLRATSPSMLLAQPHRRSPRANELAEPLLAAPVEAEKPSLTVAMQTWAQHALSPEADQEKSQKFDQERVSPKGLAPIHVREAGRKAIVDDNESLQSVVEQRVRRPAPTIQGPFVATVEQVLTRAKTDSVLTRAPVRGTSGLDAVKISAPTKHADARKTESEASTSAVSLTRSAADDPAAPPPTLPFTPVAEAMSVASSPTTIQDAAPLAPMAPLMLDDASLRAVLLPTIARISLEAGDSGRLNLELKVRDGVTELRANGPAAPLLEARQGEIRVALAKEGLALGHFDLTHSGSHQHHAEHREIELIPASATPKRSGSTEAVTEDGRIHVKA